MDKIQQIKHDTIAIYLRINMKNILSHLFIKTLKYRGFAFSLVAEIC